MTITADQFRANFPEFGDKTVYPDSGINYWLAVIVAKLDASRWTTLYDLGCQLFIAHNLVLERNAFEEAKLGAPPGEAHGPLTAESGNGVSASYEAASGLEKDAGDYTLTIYGLRYIRLARQMGSGGLQL